MRNRIAALALLLTGAAMGALSPPAFAETAGFVANERIIIDYVEPRHPTFSHGLRPDDEAQAAEYKRLDGIYRRFMDIRARMMKAKLLETFSQFLAPLKLPVDLRLRTQQCNTINAFYDGDESVILICYEFLDAIEAGAPKETTPEGITRRDAILGQIIGVMLHEGGHAVSNLLQLPVLGREEDTADQIAAYVMLQFGPEVAATLIKGEAYGWNLGHRRYPPLYWDSHSTDLQRQHTYLCIAYGRYPDIFASFVERGWLPKARAANCADEYRQAERAFNKTIRPYIDEERMKQVLARKWVPAMLSDGR
jgi:hypothetical protein